MTVHQPPNGDRTKQGLAWRETGEGATIIFLHGLGGSRAAWGPQLRAFGGRYRCVAWDMPGYGASAPVVPLSFSVISRAVVDLLDLLGVETATLIGLSFGGMHALHATLDHPNRVSRLVLADTSPAFGLDGTTSEAWTTARLAPLDDGLAPADFAENVLDAITAAPLEGLLRTEAIEAFGRISADGLRAAVNCLPSHNVLDRLGEIGQPTLVIVGELDEETPPSYAQRLADGIANSTLCTLPNVGHLTPTEAPEAFNAAVERFLTAES